MVNSLWFICWSSKGPIVFTSWQRHICYSTLYATLLLFPMAKKVNKEECNTESKERELKKERKWERKTEIQSET